MFCNHIKIKTKKNPVIQKYYNNLDRISRLLGSYMQNKACYY